MTDPQFLHAGEPVSVSLDSKESTVGLSELSPGSSYEVSIISSLGLDESDPVKDFVMTRESCTVISCVYLRLSWAATSDTLL